MRSPLTITSARYRRWRLRYLADNPLCSLCLERGRTVEATELDHHPTPRSQGGALMDRSNVRALCRPCHEIASRAQQGAFAGRGGVLPDGTPVARL